MVSGARCLVGLSSMASEGVTLELESRVSPGASDFVVGVDFDGDDVSFEVVFDRLRED